MITYRSSILPLVAAVALTACSEKTEPTSAPPPPAPGADATPAKDAAKDASAAVEKKATDAAQPGSSAVSDATAAISAKVKEAVTKAQGLLQQGKLQEAQDALKSLADVKLTPEQQSTVDALKAQIQQAMAALKAGGGDATKSAKDLVPK